MREHNKRWLISIMKTSGSKRKHVVNGRYADDRHLQHQYNPEELPKHEGIKSTLKFYNGKINYGLLFRFLRRQTGNDWNEAYAEIMDRIPTKLLDYKEMVFWFVADKVEMKDGRPWNKRSQRFIWTGETIEPIHGLNPGPQFIEFYVHPHTNKLVRVEHSIKRKERKKNNVTKPAL